MSLQVRRWAAAAVLTVAAAASAASQNPPADADRVLCEQLNDLSQVKAAVQATLSQSKAAEETIVALAVRMAGDLEGCGKTPQTPACQPAHRSQVTTAIQKLTAQAEDLQTARQAIEERLKEIGERQQTLVGQLIGKDSCPHAK